MKITKRIFSYMLSFAVLFFLWVQSPVDFIIEGALLIPYCIALLISPVLGVLRYTKVFRGFLCGFTIFFLCVGFPFLLASGSSILALAVLTLGITCLFTLLIVISLTQEEQRDSILFLRGVPEKKVRRIHLFRKSYAFFFEKSKYILPLLFVFSIFLCEKADAALVWSLSILSVSLSFIGYILYLILGAPIPEAITLSKLKGKRIVIGALCFLLLLIFIYIFVGFMYLSPEPSLLQAAECSNRILMPALAGAVLGYVSGLLGGFLLSFLCPSLFRSISQGFLGVPAAFLSAMLYPIFKSEFLAIATPLFFYGAYTMLQGLHSVRAYKGQPILRKGKYILTPLLHKPNLTAFFPILLKAIFASITITFLYNPTIFDLSMLSGLFAVSIFSGILMILFIVCYGTKEVHYRG